MDPKINVDETERGKELPLNLFGSAEADADKNPIRSKKESSFLMPLLLDTAMISVSGSLTLIEFIVRLCISALS